jgi:hypothetical protein
MSKRRSALEMTEYPGSWMAPIGGILASVTPKHRSEIKLDDKVVQEEENSVRVTGEVTPKSKEQQIRVEMTRPDESVVTESVNTDENGHFSAVFDLTQKEEKPGIAPIGGMTYTFQAHIINATQLAPAASNIVWYKLEGRDKKSSRRMTAPVSKENHQNAIHGL